jgi:site-specific DNA-cytosine methylase
MPVGYLRRYEVEVLLTHFSTFTGTGAVDLAAEEAGFVTVGQCEIDDYCTKLLEGYWPGLPRWRDIHDVTAESVREKGVQKIDLLTGGPPCQPVSIAGRRRGKEDDRFLWPEFIRVLSELRPTWVVAENPPGIVKLALDDVLTEMESQGYSCQAYNIPACSVQAPHQRARIFIVGYSQCGGFGRESRGGQGRSLRTDLWEWKNGLWPTPNSRDWKGAPGQGCWERGGHQSSLPREVKMWATCTSRDYKDTGDCTNVPTNGLLGRMVHPSKSEGSLNPDWVEILMGLPIGYTNIDGLPQKEQSSTPMSLPA